jgi:transcriptional regulator with XRE-family HTH domain
MPTLYPASPLRQLRLRLGIPLAIMSQALGINIATLSMIERDLLNPPRPDIMKAMRRWLDSVADSTKE